jgi:hypothetical protein
MASYDDLVGWVGGNLSLDGIQTVEPLNVAEPTDGLRPLTTTKQPVAFCNRYLEALYMYMHMCLLHRLSIKNTHHTLKPQGAFTKKKREHTN